MFEAIQKFSLASHQGSYEYWPRKTMLYYRGENTGTKVPGYVIEAQFNVSGYFFIITSYDCPFEEANSFLLLDQHFTLMDSAFVGRWYDTFLLEDYKIISHTEIVIKYQGDYFVRVTLCPERRWLFFKRVSYRVCDGFP